MKQYIIGVDGGGTKTDCVLLDTAGVLVDMLRWGCTSHEFLPGGYEACAREIGAMLSAVFSRNNIAPKSVIRGVFGMAGVDTAWQQKKLSAIVEAQGLANCIVCNDGYLGIKAGTSRGVGLNVINGTGCSFAGINASGERMQIGGQGVIMDDVAGGFIIGRAIIRLVHNELFLYGKKTLLTPMLMEKTGVADRNMLIDELVRRVGEGSLEIKHLSYMLFEAAAKKDEVARETLAQMGRQMALYCKSIIRSLRLDEEKMIELVLIGSNFVKAEDDTHIRVMQEELRRVYPGVCLIPLGVKPVCGAALWAFEEEGLLTPAVKENILQQLEQ